MEVRLKPQALNELETTCNLKTNEQLAAATGLTVTRIQKLKTGSPIDLATALRIAIILGYDLNLSQVIERIPENTAAA